MLFLTYWELNEETSRVQRMQAGQKLLQTGLFPPAGINIIRWDATVDGWGILVAEAEDFTAINRALDAWRIAVPGMFTVTRTAPAQPVQEVMASTAEFMQKMAAVTG
ncbi:MAG: hypothetical protein FOGNACKC_01711 [Anaerolineae bacterium]|nr:hypothetical protein [Anaerolineae bacterium]